MHSCGILISEEPITNYTVLEMPPKGFPLALFDMHIAENIGFEKFDILSQRGIGHIDDTVKLVQKKIGLKSIFEIQHYQKMKQSVMNFKHWKTIGCFISKVLPCVDYCDGLNVTIIKF
jgi:DNA polymerase-3 subunit alpha/error-prone DNA polymerase